MRCEVRTGKIPQKPSAQLPAARIRQKASSELMPISETPSRKSAVPGIPFFLSWSHYVFLVGIRDDSERRFAEKCSVRTFGQQAADQLPWFHLAALITRLSKDAKHERYSRLPTFEQIEAELQSELDRDREGEGEA